MEQFKRLKWSWHKYEEEKNFLPRNFSFETINDNDALARHLNEIHTCVIPNQTEYRIFKTPEEIERNRTEIGVQFDELKDPRKSNYSKLKLTNVMRTSYSSELRKDEHSMILACLYSDTVFNPKLVKDKKCKNLKKFEELPQKLLDKWKKEVDHFQRCSEIFYHKNIAEFNSLLSVNHKKLMTDYWKKLEAQFDTNLQYQAITMILRNYSGAQHTDPIELKYIKVIDSDFNKDLYKMPENHFPNLQNVPVESLKLFLQSKNCHLQNNPQKTDIQISLDVLTTLFVHNTEFTTIFINQSDSTKFILDPAVPHKKIHESTVLCDLISTIFHFNIEWHNTSKCVQTSSSQNIDFKLQTINETMSRVFKSYKKSAGLNNEISLWQLKELSIAVYHTKCYFGSAGRKLIFSLKFEFQSNFGAEQMTREELLREWVQMRFCEDADLLRYRIDAKSLEILSLKKLSLSDIERELHELYSCDPMPALQILFNTLNCVHNLPDGTYIIQGQCNENDVNKLLIYKQSDQGKNILNDKDFEINETFTRKWIAIDKKVPTFVHLVDEIAPCCFSYKSSCNATSYILHKNSSSKKAGTVKKVIESKLPQNTQALRKRTRKRGNRNKKKGGKKVTTVKNLK